ncbi:hypothetical protein G9A89_004524 [Geosiphon pyriformis]|nr:hypothetical protein G9A89_004524 [Geosiphon pyriformis]
MESNQKQPLTNNIPSAIVTNNESLAAIFPFNFEEIILVLLFSRTVLNAKPITVMYTNGKVDEKKPISSCALESELPFNTDSNSNDDNNNNNDFSFMQYGNNNNNNDSNSNTNPEQYIALFNLSKEQELKWFSDNNEGIMLE